MNAGPIKPSPTPEFAVADKRRGRRATRSVPAMFCALILSSAAGCIPVPRGDDSLDVRFMTADELREYSERVFRRHNRVTTRLMMAPPLDDAVSRSARRQIEKAESRMYDACATLNEIAAARSSGREVERALENEARKTVRACAESTRRLESLLDEHEVGSRSP